VTYGLQIRNASNVLLFDSNLVLGGVIAGYFTYGSGATDTLSFTQFASRSADIITMDAPSYVSDDIGVTVSTGSGHPVVTVADRPFSRSFLVVVW
jgi:hypothetical protein